MSEVEWKDLPTLVRRSFEVYLQRFAAENPGCSLVRTLNPRRDGDSIVVPFEDAVSGARYVALMDADGSVASTEGLA